MKIYDVSVVLAAYNVEKYIEKSIKSVLQQKGCKVQLVVVNDGSTDNTPQIIQKISRGLEDVVIVNQENKGLGAARNSGLRLADGEYVTFLDGDDYVDTFMYGRLYKEAKRFDADIVGCLHVCFLDGSDEISHVYPKFPFSSESVFFDRESKDKYRGLLNFSACNKIFRSNLPIQFPEGLLHEDVPLMFELFLSGTSVLMLGESLHWYRQSRGGQITQKKDISRFDIFKISSLVRGSLKTHSANDGWFSFYYRWKVSFFNTIFKRLIPELRKKFFFNCYSSFKSDPHSKLKILKLLPGKRLRASFFCFGIYPAFLLLTIIDSVHFWTRKFMVRNV